MAAKWSAKDVRSLIAITSASMCLLILVLGLLILTAIGKLTPELLGSIKGIGIGGGFVVLASILYLIIKVSIA